ncbi:hypothetical protein [Kitasatospora phosalacinea]|uniref:hypothetical protein n=1 Tax=Kitasatospora phosalacinea TaxID=2065 RepID=UPI0025558EE9|nr:hypothetical protein [Kitasatospora phosalacinea]
MLGAEAGGEQEQPVHAVERRCQRGGVAQVADRAFDPGGQDDRDQRLVRLRLTDAGRALQGPVETERRLLEERVTADLTPEERRLLLTALAKVHRATTALLAEQQGPAADPAEDPAGPEHPAE